jgi:hypothetical protein
VVLKRHTPPPFTECLYIYIYISFKLEIYHLVIQRFFSSKFVHPEVSNLFELYIFRT